MPELSVEIESHKVYWVQAKRFSTVYYGSFASLQSLSDKTCERLSASLRDEGT